MTLNARKTATALYFSPDESAVLAEALRIARTEIRRNCEAMERTWPATQMVERVRMLGERMGALQRRLDQ